MDYLFLGCDSRIGMYRVRGPVSGNELCVPILGTWINEEDAVELCDQTVEIYCHRAKCNIIIHPVFELNCTEDQMKLKPTTTIS